MKRPITTFVLVLLLTGGCGEARRRPPVETTADGGPRTEPTPATPAAGGTCPAPQISSGATCVCPADACVLGARRCGPNGGRQDCVSRGACTTWGVEVACHPFACSEGSCKSTCASSRDCASGLACAAQTCVVIPSGFAEFEVPGGKPIGITVGPDGNLWFTDQMNLKIGRMTVTGDVTQFDIAWKAQTITTGPDGNLWFTQASNKIARMSPEGQLLGEYDGGLSGNGKIVTGPDGNLWFTQCGANQIGRLTIAGMLTNFPIAAEMACPMSIVVGSDGNLWFTELLSHRVGRITPDGRLDSFPLQEEVRPNSITVGPDGDLYFSEFWGNRIARMSTAGGLIAEYPVATPDSGPAGITSGPDGAIWFALIKAHKIGRLAPDGTMTEYATPSAGSTPYEIVLGPDGSLWFTEVNAGKIGRYRP
jgi:streptogramin lyase